MGFGSIAPYYDPMTGLPIGAPEPDVATVPPVVAPRVPVVEDWREREAQAGLALQQADKLKAERAAQTWGSLAREIPGNLLNMAKGLVAPALPADPNAPPSLGPAAFGTMSPGEAALQPETVGGRVVRGVGNMIAEGAKSGFTAPHDSMTGEIPQWDAEGHTSPAMIQRSFDTASMATGASVAGTAEKAAAKAAAEGALEWHPPPVPDRPALAPPPALEAVKRDGTWFASDTGKPGAAIAVAGHAPPVAALEHAPPFYSHLEQAVTEAPIKKATGEQWLGTLSNKPGVKPEEMDWTGLRTFLKEKADQPVTKEEVAAHIGENKVQLGEVHKGYNAQKEARSAELNARPEESLTQAEYQELRALDDTGATDAKFENYQLPGGENYREKLLTMPINLDEAAMQKYGKPYSDLPRGQQVSTRQGAGGYKSSHWDEPNVLVHRRTNERDVGGVPSLHVEELQSDWHQAGRKQGYGQGHEIKKDDGGYYVRFPDGNESMRFTTPEQAKKIAGAWSGVPDAPFKKTEAWTTLGLKDAIREAAEKGIDRISITPGDIHPTNPKNLGRKGAEADRSSEGMKSFYDKMVPDALNKIGKPHGVKVQSGTSGSHYSLVDKEGKPGQSFANKAEADAWFAKNPRASEFWDLKKDDHPVHYMDIPPSLKEQALKKGFSLFEDTGPTATALAVAERAGYVNPHEAAAAARGAEAPLRGGGGTRGVEEAQAAAARHAGAVELLAGLPNKPLTVGGESYVPGPIGRVHDVAKDYMASTGRTYERADRYHPIDTEHSTAIAKAFDEMKHEPDNPKVKASYDAMVNETKDQYNELKKSGIKIEAIPPGAPDPYAETPRLAAKDVAENNHLWFFPTESGFGTNPSGHDMAAHPLMRASGETLNGKPLLNNDLFRIVHDYFGHLKEGHGFRAAGEDNAWRTHAKMYSDEARPAMTTETRGQNSWVNYGPHGETNRTASAADTHFADQKVGLLPEWTMRDKNPHGFGELDSHPNERALTVNDILSPETPKMEPRSRDVETIAKELMDRGSSALEKMGVEGGRIEKSAPHTDELLSRGIASEIKAALGRGNTASDWYTKKISEAMDTATEMHPELKDNPHQKMAFTSALAITSQGEAVTSNVRLANQVYQHFKDTGRFPDKIDAKKGPSMVSNFHKMNALLDELGPEGTREFLHKEFTVKELEKAGYDVGGENKQAKVYGSSILGPKIGQGFYQNLNGNYKPVTMDLWFMRAWGRMTGTLVGKTDMSPQIARLQDAMKAEGMKVPKDPEGLAAAAREAVQKHERDYRTNQADYKSGKKSKSELTYAAERYEKNATGINEQPTSGSQRQWMRDVVNRSREILADHGHKVTNADLQAIWWYPEKELYSKLGGRDSDKINIDYATAFRDLKARSGGVVPEPAAAVVPAPSGGRPADKADVSRASAGSGKGSKKAARQKVSSFGSIAPGMVG